MRFIVLILSYLIVPFSYAQQQILSEHEIQIKQGLERIKNNTDPFLQRQNIFLQNSYAQEDKDKVDNATTECFDIKNITIEGNTQIDKKVLNNITDAFVDDCLNLYKINQLISAISNQYLQAGYTTSRAYIAPQNLKDGQLTLIVVEGVIEAFNIDKTQLTQRQLMLAFPTKIEKVLNLRDLEQGLENLNRLSQNQVTTSLTPGSFQGASIIELSNQNSKPWQSSISLNNNGNEETGKHQLDLFYVHNNLFGVNDNIVATASSNVGGKNLDHAISRSYSLNMDLPYHYWLFALSNSFFEYEQTIQGNSVNFITSGTSLSTRLSIENRIYRDQNSTFDVRFALSRKESKNFLEDIFLETSSRTLYFWDFSGNYKQSIPSGNIDFSFQISKSVPWFGAKRKVVAAENDFQFTRYQLNGAMNLFFEWGTQTVRYQVSGQYTLAPKNIILSEGFSVGGRYTVRGISEDSLYGYRGGYIRNDLTFPLTIDSTYLSQLSLSVGLDAGTTSASDFPEMEHKWVTGTIFSLHASRNNINLALAYAKALHIPDILQANNEQFDFKIQINF